MFCEFDSLTAGSRCKFCRMPLRHDMPRHPLRTCSPLGFLGEPIGEVQTGCNSCQATYYKCQIHGRCIPVNVNLRRWRKRPESKFFQLCFDCPTRAECKRHGVTK